MTELTAVLVDGDNISNSHAEQIRTLAAKIGTVGICRAYVDTQHLSGWDNAPGYRLIHAGSGKNASDVLMALDAMEILLQREVRRFVLASSDGDFSHIALRLREHGARVIGLGAAKAPAAFREGCNAFHEIAEGVPQGAANGGGRGAGMVPDLDLKIRSIIAQHSVKGLGMKIADLSPQMHRLHGVKISTYPEKSWRAYLLARPALYDLDPRGPEARVRFKPAGFAQ